MSRKYAYRITSVQPFPLDTIFQINQISMYVCHVCVYVMYRHRIFALVTHDPNFALGCRIALDMKPDMRLKQETLKLAPHNALSILLVKW